MLIYAYLLDVRALNIINTGYKLSVSLRCARVLVAMIDLPTPVVPVMNTGFYSASWIFRILL
jgi:hypothetical protein